MELTFISENAREFINIGHFVYVFKREIKIESVSIQSKENQTELLVQSKPPFLFRKRIRRKWICFAGSKLAFRKDFKFPHILMVGMVGTTQILPNGNNGTDKRYSIVASETLKYLIENETKRKERNTTRDQHTKAKEVIFPLEK